MYQDRETNILKGGNTMSTRCQIGFYEQGVTNLKKHSTLLYKHSDGYPDGVLPIIVPFLKRFNKERGLNDIEYAGAWLVHHLIEGHIRVMKACYRRMGKGAGKVYLDKSLDKSKLNGKDFLGHGICGDHSFHSDIAYYYAIYSDRVEVYETHRKKYGGWKLIKTVRLCKVAPPAPNLTGLRPDVVFTRGDKTSNAVATQQTV